MWLSIVHNKQWNRFSLDITRKFTNTKDGETNEGSSSTYLNSPVSKAAATCATGNTSSAVASPTTFSTVVAETWTSGANATLTNPMMSSSSTTPSFSDLASSIYSTFTLYHLKSNSNFELNLHINLFCKLCYPQLISFLDNGLSAQSNSYKSLDPVISSALCFL